MTNHISYIKGDATNPLSDGNKVIVHVCNDMGKWGKGFVMAISKKWKQPELEYRQWYKMNNDFLLGNVQFINVENDIWVANLIGQHKINKDESGNPPIRYNAILSGLEKISLYAIENKASVHMPRIGCGLAGGTWDKIEPLVITALTEKNISVTVYDF